jgi:succinate-acetate transporter protein
VELRQEQVGSVATTAKTMMYGGAGTTGGARAWAWLGENHEAITSLCSLGGFLVCLIGMVLNAYIQSKKS